jgi:hypothetical protein
MAHIRHTPRRPTGHVRRRFAAGAAPPAVAAPQSLRIPITNVYGGGDYTATLLVGSQKKPANVILDTGSSTLAVKPQAYNPSQDTQMAATSEAQVVLYGTGGWAGPVLETTIGLGGVTLPEAFIAVADVQEANNFGQADGILGLAYNIMNSAYDLTAYLKKKGSKATTTYPWTLKIKGTQAALETFANDIAHEPETDIDPYFTALEEKNVVANKLAFYTLRSFPRIASTSATLATLAEDKLNQGFLILGGGEEQKDLYTGSFAAVTVVDDLYYNVNLRSVQVGSEPPAAAAALQAEFQQAGSNAIVDSGTNSLVLAPDVYASIRSALEKINPRLAKQLDAGASADNGVPTADLALASWPNITLVLQGETGDVSLTLAPSTYWQVDSPAPGSAMLVIAGQPAGAQTPNQSILGLPLMNNYYTVFDRSADSKGVIRFASIKAGA